MSSIAALTRHLQPLTDLLVEDGVTEICLNQPQIIYVERFGQFKRHDIPAFDYPFLESLAALFAEYNHQPFPSPLLSGSLPSGERMQWGMYPVTAKGNMIFSLRRHRMLDMSLTDYAAAGSFDGLKTKRPDRQDELWYAMSHAYTTGDMINFINLAIKLRLNILISGGTGTGKTTFLNACLKLIPFHERLITVEDTREVSVLHPNSVSLLFYPDHPQLHALNIFKACLRLRPDRLFLSELRGNEVWPYLRAANSGHPGSLSTIHADTAEGALTQLVFMMQQAGSTSTEKQLRAYLKSIVHVVIQLKRSANPGQHMYLSEIYFNQPIPKRTAKIHEEELFKL